MFEILLDRCVLLMLPEVTDIIDSAASCISWGLVPYKKLQEELFPAFLHLH